MEYFEISRNRILSKIESFEKKKIIPKNINVNTNSIHDP